MLKISGVLRAGFLVVDTRPLIILLGAIGTILFPIIAIKGKPIIHIAIPITTITRILIAGIHTVTTAITGSISKPLGELI